MGTSHDYDSSARAIELQSRAARHCIRNVIKALHVKEESQWCVIPLGLRRTTGIDPRGSMNAGKNERKAVAITGVFA